ncbi:MAG: hypothetical protein JWO31_228 [Phycisphaerales bacterium]|nr:hypothetical protein [Phycisphaerales bacterium]
MPAQSGQSQPVDPTQAPNPAYNYERAMPERESPSGSLDQKYPRPHAHPDAAGPEDTSGRHTNKPDTSDSLELSTSKQPETNPGDVNHSMNDEEPTGWDLAPTNIQDPTQKRHPRPDGKGGTP